MMKFFVFLVCVSSLPVFLQNYAFEVFLPPPFIISLNPPHLNSPVMLLHPTSLLTTPTINCIN